MLQWPFLSDNQKSVLKSALGDNQKGVAQFSLAPLIGRLGHLTIAR